MMCSLAAAVSLSAALCLTLLAGPAQGCGDGLPCDVPGGSYLVEAPEGATGALVFFHGYNSSAEAQMRHRAMVEAATARGLAFVTPNGLNGTWTHPSAPSGGRDELYFSAAVLDDLEARFGFGPDDVVIGGFSQGASMAYYAVCTHGARLAGAVMLSGTFWEPIPAGCTPRVPPVIHMHGTADRTFPLEGRAIGSRWHQGDTREGLALLARNADCTTPGAAETPAPLAEAGLVCSAWKGCARGPLRLCLHDGGHSASAAMLAAGLAALGR